MNSRLKPQRIRSSDIGAEKELTVTVIKYELHNGTTREGTDYNEDRIYFEHNRNICFLRLNGKSLLYLANHGFTVTEDGLTEELPNSKLTFELMVDQGPYPFYVVVKVAKKTKSKRSNNSKRSSSK